MAIKVILYGDLKRYVESTEKIESSIGIYEIYENDLKALETISDVLKYLSVDLDEVSHIFLNREYSHHERKIKDGDRLALFPKDMALLYKWYFQKKK